MSGADQAHLPLDTPPQEPPCPWDESACAAAAGDDELEALRWLRAQDPPHLARCRGALLGALFGDALGAGVEGWPPVVIAARFPEWLTVMPDGAEYTDDFQMTLALAQSLGRRGCADALDMAAAYASAFDERRGYAPAARAALRALRAGADPRATGRATYPEGSYGNGGAMHIAPLGLAYRRAPRAVLRRAAEAALLPTHVHPRGVDGAVMIAGAAAWLCRQPLGGGGGGGGGGGPAALVEHLSGLVATDAGRDVLARLGRELQRRPECVCQPPVASWAAHLRSPLWLGSELPAASRLAPGFQIEATAAAGAALWALCCHWASPADAVVAAIHAGGDTDTIACMAGALAGALHGDGGLPPQWLAAAECGAAAAAAAAAAALAALDCVDAPPPW
ncbi:MAG: ADP-ribosylglycohydrolase-domain-containing protein [Monoraphidium minutum]|nr:MAG: ADP-ribosylglycohydrolase-domain-containing protein [Monoraphidium minutum]